MALWYGYWAEIFTFFAPADGRWWVSLLVPTFDFKSPLKFWFSAWQLKGPNSAKGH